KDMQTFSEAQAVWHEKGNEAPGVQGLMQTGIGSEGGFGLVPVVERGIKRRIFDLSPIRQFAAKKSLSQGLQWMGLYETVRADAGWRGELQQVTATGNPEIENLSITLHELNSQPIATQWEVRLGNQLFNVEQFLLDSVSQGQAIVEGDAFWTGDSINKPRGITDYPTSTSDDASRAWGTLQYIPTGAAGGFDATTFGDVFYSVLGQIKRGQRTSARWFMARATMAKVMQMRTSEGSYLWQQTLQQNGFQ
ncbi:unnamed protein product, partial [marine sediment metagenome]